MATASKSSVTMSVTSPAKSKTVPKVPYVHHPSFEVKSTSYVEEYSAGVVLYKHKKTGAEIMSVSIADENKVRLLV